MLPDYLLAFNEALLLFQNKFPKKKWLNGFRNTLINDYSFFSARVEDSKLQYGDTILFLNTETKRAANINPLNLNLSSLLDITNHQSVLKDVLDNLRNFKLTENTVKNIHRSLMSSPLVWEVEFKPELVGRYRNIPTVGSRFPHFENKEYNPHYNLEIIMATYIDIFRNKLKDIDNTNTEKHLLTRIAYFHNKFLNEIHPFADGNGRVCRIIIGAILMKNHCPPIFPEITTDEEQIEYISTIVKCEQNKSDEPLIAYFANGMTKYLLKRVNN